MSRFVDSIRSNPRNRVAAGVFITLFAIIGVIFLYSIHAASPNVSLNAADGTVTGNATTVNDSAAKSGKVVRFGGGLTSSTLPIKAAFYYPWFPGAWNQQGFNPFSNYTPSLGNYSSTDTTVINTHIDDLIYAGMDAGIYSWWGQGSTEDTRFQSFLDATGSKPLKWALYYECEGNASGGTCGNVGGPAPSSTNIASDLAYIKSKYTNDSHYLRVNNKPVIFVYGDATDSCTTASNWATANANQGFYVVLKVFGGFASCASQPDNWHQYGPASAEDVQTTHSISISPGYWKKGCPQVSGGTCTQGGTQPYLARDLTRWATNVTDLKNSTANFKLITTYNEWGEGSIIESASGSMPSGWQSSSGHGQFVDTLHQILVTGTPVDNPPTASLTSPAAGTVSGNVTLTATASDDHGVTKIEFLVDGNVVNTSGANPASPYSFTWNSASVASGSHVITARATDTINQQTTSSSVTVTVSQPDTTPPTVPGSFTSSLPVPTNKTVHLTWTASTDSGSGLKNYILSRNGTVIASPTAGTTSYDDSTTVYSTAYTYTIAAVDNATNTSSAATTSITTPAAPADTQAPNVPTSTATVVSTTQVTISWNTVTDNPTTGGASGVKGYKVFRDGVQMADVAAPSTSTNDGPFSFVTGQSYKYTVLAYDVAGNPSAQSTGNSVIPNPVVSTGNVCGNTATGNKIDTIVVISEENRTWSNVGLGFSATNMPYVHNIAAQCGYFTNDTEVNTSDNSAQQYVGAWTGFDASTTNVSNDCSPSTSCSTTVNNIFRAFRNAGIPHREYVEGATSTCSASGNAAKHIPELYMWDATDKAACGTEVLPMSQFNFASPPTGYTFITPTLCNDGHDCADSTVNTWLSDPSRLPALFNTAQYKAGKVLVELWYDEDHPKPNMFACWSCKQFVSTTDPHYSGESLLWLNLLGAPSSNLGGISTGTDIRSIVGTP